MLQIQVIECPKCGALLKNTENRKIAYCEYCGAKLAISDDSIQTKNININQTITYVDQAEAERNEAKKWEALSAYQKSHTKRVIIAIAAILYSIVLLVCFLSNRTGNAVGLILIPILVYISHLIMKHGQTSVHVTKNSKFFGLITDYEEKQTTPEKKVLYLWIIGGIILLMCFGVTIT